MSGQYLNCESKKAFIKIFLFDKIMYWLTSASALIFYHIFYIALIYDNQRSTYCQNGLLKVSHSFSPISIFIFSHELTSKWYLWGLLFVRLLSDHSSSSFKDFSKDQVIYIKIFPNAYVTWQEHTVKCTVQITTHNSSQSFGQFGQMVECSFTK